MMPDFAAEFKAIGADPQAAHGAGRTGEQAGAQAAARKAAEGEVNEPADFRFPHGARRGPAPASRPLGQGGPRLAPPAGPAHDLAAAAAGPPARRDRDAPPPSATHRAAVEPSGPA